MRLALERHGEQARRLVEDDDRFVFVDDGKVGRRARGRPDSRFAGKHVIVAGLGRSVAIEDLGAPDILQALEPGKT